MGLISLSEKDWYIRILLRTLKARIESLSQLLKDALEKPRFPYADFHCTKSIVLKGVVAGGRKGQDPSKGFDVIGFSEILVSRRKILVLLLLVKITVLIVNRNYAPYCSVATT